MDPKELCIALAQAETEEEAVKILRNANYWDDEDAWSFYGGFEGNYSDIGNQQTKPECALVEKLINSVDAMLIQACVVKGIHPESKQAPSSIFLAVETFFGIHKGNLANIDPTTRSKLAESICLIATGSKSSPCYLIIDKAEGQTPSSMPTTFLSLPDRADKNKLRIPFVQGRFNMGGTGVLRFCSKLHNLELIISRKNPQMAKQLKGDSTAQQWGFTIVRRENSPKRKDSSSFKYLAPQGKIISFDAESLALLPGKYPSAYSQQLSWGSVIKLYEYQMSGLRAPIILDAYNRLSLLTPNIALPVRLYERRNGYTAHSYEATLSGLSVRLEEDKRENLEPGYPNSGSISARGQKMDLLVYAFKKGAEEKYRKNEGIIFVVNGQTQGRLTTDFFARKSVGLHYLQDSILVVVDCSTFDGRAREELFMNNREQLSDGDFRKEIEGQIEELLKHHQGLRELKEQRRREEIQTKLEDSKPLLEVLNDIMQKSPALASLFSIGNKIPNPFKTIRVKGTGVFKGKLHPTFFALLSDNGSTYLKHCPINRRFRVQFKTDVENEYFVRDNSPGEFSLAIQGKSTNDYLINLWNGMGNLTVHLPIDVKIGDTLKCRAAVSDETLINPFINEFNVIVQEAAKPSKGGTGGKRKKDGGQDHGETEVPSTLSLPEVVEVREPQWITHCFDRFSALKVKDNGEGGYDFFVNMDNVYLLTELKNRNSEDPKLTEAQYKYALVLIGLAMLKQSVNDDEGEKPTSGEGHTFDDGKVFDEIKAVTRALSTIIIPLITYLGALELEPENVD